MAAEAVGGQGVKGEMCPSAGAGLLEAVGSSVSPDRCGWARGGAGGRQETQPEPGWAEQWTDPREPRRGEIPAWPWEWLGPGRGPARAQGRVHGGHPGQPSSRTVVRAGRCVGHWGPVVALPWPVPCCRGGTVTIAGSPAGSKPPRRSSRSWGPPWEPRTGCPSARMGTTPARARRCGRMGQRGPGERPWGEGVAPAVAPLPPPRGVTRIPARRQDTEVQGGQGTCGGRQRWLPAPATPPGLALGTEPGTAESPWRWRAGETPRQVWTWKSPGGGDRGWVSQERLDQPAAESSRRASMSSREPLGVAAGPRGHRTGVLWEPRQ